MSVRDLIKQQKFWEILQGLFNLEQACEVHNFCEKYDVERSQLHFYLNFLQDVGHGIDFGKVDDKLCIIPPEQSTKIKVELSLMDWLMFQCYFPFLSEIEGLPFKDLMAEKLGRLESKFSKYDIYPSLAKLEKILAKNESQIQAKINQAYSNEVIEFLEESITERASLSVKHLDGSVLIYPMGLVYIDSELCLVCESINDNGLMCIQLSQIVNMREYEHEWKAINGIKEVKDFISALRAVTQSEIRLILKIYSIEKFNDSIRHELITNPCMVTNPDGDYIWAATVGPSEAVFEWLSEIGTEVEIIDPLSFKKKFLEYCETSLKKIA